MSKTVLILFAACTGLSLLSLHLVQRMRASQAQVTELQEQVAKLEQQQQQMSALPPPVAPVSTLQPEPVAPPPPPAPSKESSVVTQLKRLRPASEESTFASGPSREERMRMVREARERQRQLMQDPDYREAMRVQHRSNMVRQYPGVAQELGLTTEQTDKLFDLLTDQQMRNNEQSEFLFDTEVDPATMQQRQEKMAQRWAEMQQKTEAELSAQLGPDKLQAWKEYQSTLGARHQAEHLKTTLAGRGVPLSEDASRAVVKAYAEAQKVEMQEYANMATAARANAASSGKTAMVGLQMRGVPPAEMYERQIENTKKRNQRVLDVLSPYLTYEQREALQKEQEAELKMQEAQMRIMRAQSSVDGGTHTDWVSNSQAIILPAQ